jgi:hypothetical protein
MDGPKLIEPSMQNHLFNTLQQCHSNRVNVYFYALNIGVVVLLVLFFGGTLYYCSKQKLGDYEKNQRMVKDQQYILSKIRYYQDDKKNRQQSQGTGITDLPYITTNG